MTKKISILLLILFLRLPTVATAASSSSSPLPPPQTPAAAFENSATYPPLPKDLMEVNWILSAHTGLNLLSVFALDSGQRTANRIGAKFGAHSDFYLSRFFGLGIGAEITSRGFSPAASLPASSSFIDLPFGIIIRTPSIFGGLDGNAVATFEVGGYASVPLRDFEVSDLPINSAKTSFGLHFSGKTLFPVADNWAIGFSTWGKVGLTDSYNAGVFPNSGSLLEVGIGFIASYF